MVLQLGIKISFTVFGFELYEDNQGIQNVIKLLKLSNVGIIFERFFILQAPEAKLLGT
jgi:hypothetical protein